MKILADLQKKYDKLEQQYAMAQTDVEQLNNLKTNLSHFKNRNKELEEQMNEVNFIVMLFDFIFVLIFILLCYFILTYFNHTYLFSRLI
jgi:hypothetical protein